MSKPILTSEQLLDQAFGSNNTTTNTEVDQALGNNQQKPSKAIGVNISVITPTKQQVEDTTLFLGSAFSIDVGFLEPYQYDKGLPPQNGDSLKSQIFHLSIQRQHEEYSLMKHIADRLIENGVREYTVNWDEVDAERFPFTVRTWGKSGMTWHFINRKIARAGGEKLAADKVATMLEQLL